MTARTVTLIDFEKPAELELNLTGGNKSGVK
jgi:hypothetical protein